MSIQFVAGHLDGLARRRGEALVINCISWWAHAPGADCDPACCTRVIMRVGGVVIGDGLATRIRHLSLIKDEACKRSAYIPHQGSGM